MGWWNMANNTVIIDTSEVKAWLALKANTGSIPALSDPEINILLKEHATGNVWVAETNYKFDDVVIPTSDNRTGRRFRCITPGIADTQEPDWSNFIGNVHNIISGVDLGNDGSRALVLQDGDARWVDDGAETDLWNLEELAHAAWMAKASKASEFIRLNRGGNDYDWEAIYRHCIDMAGRFGGAFIK